MKNALSLFLVLLINLATVWGEQKSTRLFLNTTNTGANIQNNLYNFPILIRLNEQNFNFKVSNGSDIRFLSSENASLYFYIERFDTSDKVAEIFVKIPEIVANNKTQFIKMLYGDPDAPGGQSSSSAVFDNQYSAMWLMDTKPVHGCYNAIKDRTTFGNNGTAYNTYSSNQVTGKVGNAIKFDGCNDYIWMCSTPNINQLTNNFTVSCWMKTQTLCGYHKMVSASKYYEDGFGLGIYNNRLYFATYGRQGYVLNNFSLQCNKWYYVTAVLDQCNDVHFYVNGEKKGVVYGDYPALRNNSSFFLGATTQSRSNYLDQLWQGELDQISIASTKRSADWLKLEYENQRDDQQFVQMETDKGGDFKVVPNLSYYSLYATGNIYVRDNSKIYGIIGTDNGGYVDLGFGSYIKGDIYSGQNITMSQDVVVSGDATAEGAIYSQHSSQITGEMREYTPAPQFNMPEKQIGSVGRSFYISPGEMQRIPPVNFNLLVAEDSSTVIFSAGTYNCMQLNFVGNNVHFIIDIGPHESVEINVDDNITFGPNFSMTFANVENPLAVKIHSNQTDINSILTFPGNAEYYGIFSLPYASKVVVGNGAKIYGSIYAKEIEVGTNAIVCKPPFLTDLAHSEWAYAPPFNPQITKYVAVVPPSTTSILVTPTPATAGTIVTVNGGAADVPLNINSDTTFVSIELDGGDCGLGAVYSLELRKSPDYVIYVDDDRRGTGDSWLNAFEFLNDALVKANVEGKEIWVAEGIYNHFYIDWMDEFVIQPGTELIGGFKGGEEGETERKPRGSIYSTILTADNDNNDHSISTWPPSENDMNNYLNDNAPFVISFLNGGKGAISSKIEGFTIQGGVARPDNIPENWEWYSDKYSIPENYLDAGIYYASKEPGYAPICFTGSGGGIYNSHCSPTINKCHITRNYAFINGGGMFSRSGPKLMQNCLFEKNFCSETWGGGMYALFFKQGTIDGLLRSQIKRASSVSTMIKSLSPTVVINFLEP